MNIEKIGKFIKLLREERNLTQDKLAESIPISRQAISKWERGLAVPDSSVLLRLSEIFDVSINEILVGEKETKNNTDKINKLPLKIYDDRNKKNKIIKILIAMIIFFIIFILLSYFINSYKLIKVYTISGNSNNVNISNGIFVKTNEKIFFRIGDFSIKDNTEIKSLRLYYLDKRQTKKDIIFTSNDNIMLIDYNGYNEYFEFSNINNIISNLYLDIELPNDIESVKLEFVEDYINDSIFNIREKTVKESNSTYSENNLLLHDEYIISQIKAKYKNDELGYFFTINDKPLKKTITYDEDVSSIRIIAEDKEKILERWIYQLNNHILEYQSYENNESFIFENDNITCLTEFCNNSEEKIKKFYQYISLSLK